jgi:hypothetical protein
MRIWYCETEDVPDQILRMVSQCALLSSSRVSMIGRLRVGDKTMSVSEQVRPLLAARAATDPCAARLLEMFDKANELLERSPYKSGDVEIFNSQSPKP